MAPGLVVKKGTNRLSGFATPGAVVLRLEYHAVVATDDTHLAGRRIRGRRLDRVADEIDERLMDLVGVAT